MVTSVPIVSICGFLLLAAFPPCSGELADFRPQSGETPGVHRVFSLLLNLVSSKIDLRSNFLRE